MSNREFTAQRTMLANAFATAGAELMEYMGTAAALAAIPNTEPPRFVVAGTLAEMVKLLPAAEVIKPSAVEQPTGDLTDEQILEALGSITHEVPKRLPPGWIKFARAIERAAIAAYLARQAQAEPITHKDVEWLVECAEMARRNPDLATEIRAKCKAVAPAGAQNAQPVAAWMTEDGDRVVSAATKEGQIRDGGASASAMRPYSVALVKQAGAQNAEAIRNQAEPEPIECWSRDEEDFNARSLADLVDSHDDLKPGDTVFVGEAVHPDPARLVNEDSIIENIGEAAYDIGGEYAEDYPKVKPEQAKELESLVADWIKRNCPPTFYTVANIKPYVLSHEDFSGALQTGSANTQEGGDK